MLDYFKVNSVDLLEYADADTQWNLSRVTGLFGLPAVRGESKTRAEQHGTTNRGKRLASKIITLEGEVWGSDIFWAHEGFNSIARVLYGTLADEGGAYVEWRTGGAITEVFHSYMKLVGEVLPPIENSAAVLVWQAQLEQMDPRAYSGTLVTGLRHNVGTDLAAGGGGLTFPFTFPFDFDESTGGLADADNAGTIETPPIVRIYGPVTSPRYVYHSDAGVVSDSQVKINGEIAAGDYLEIDHAERTIKLNGGALRMNLLDPANSEFFDLAVGGGSVRLFALNFAVGAHIEVDSYDAHA